MNKITWGEMYDIFTKFNGEHGNNPTEQMTGVVVFTESSFSIPFTVAERSYRVSSNNMAFKAGKISNSIYGNCLDGKDLGVRLDWYMYDAWEVDYCYLD